MSIANLPSPTVTDFSLEVIPLSPGGGVLTKYFQRLTSMQGTWIRKFEDNAYSAWTPA